jgi:VanZ family protein
MTIVFRIFAWLLAAAVALATLGPTRYRPLNYSLGRDGEHALAFALIGLVFGLAYARNRLLTAAIAIVLIGALEILQLWAPGRHARLEDFAVDALATIAGLVAAAGLNWVVGRLRAPNSGVT